MRKIIHKFVCLVCAIVFVFSFVTSSFADASGQNKRLNLYENNGSIATNEDISRIVIYKHAKEIAATKGIEILDEKVVFSDADNKNYQIAQTDQIVSSKDNIMISVPKSAYSLVESGASIKTLSANGEVWFSFKTPSAGAYNIYTTGSVNTYGTLYKKGTFGLSEVKKSGTGGSGNNFKMKCDLDCNTMYYIKVTGGTTSSKGNFTIYLKGNMDSKSSNNGGIWNWTSLNKDPDGAYYNIDQITFLTADQATGYLNLVKDDKYKKVRDNIIKLSATKAVEYVMGCYDVSEKTAKWILDALGFGSVFCPDIPTLTSMEINSIKKVTDYDSTTGRCKKGMAIYSVTVYTSNSSGAMIPVMINTYEKWSGSKIYGEKYYWGTFKTPTNPKPLWR